MKTIAALVMVAGLGAVANADILANWTYEVSVPTTAGPFAAEAGVNAATSQSLGGTGGTYSNPVGNGTVESFSSNGWDVGDYFQFSTSTLGYNGITVQFDQVSSGTGPRDFNLQYSVNGTDFFNIQSYSVLANATPNNFWSSGTYFPEHTYTGAGPAAMDNQATVWFRMTQATTVSANGATVAAAGTSRFDSVIINGNVVPAPASVALLGLAGLVGGRRRR